MHKPGIVPEAQRANALKIMAENAKASEWILQKPSPNYPKSNVTTGGTGTGTKRRSVWLFFVLFENDSLPRQARDKHREETLIKARFCVSAGAGAHMTAGLFGVKWFLMALAVRKALLSAPFYTTQRDHFTKTGSGQT